MQAIQSLQQKHVSTGTRSQQVSETSQSIHYQQTPIRVLLIDPDPLSLRRHSSFLTRIPGFQLTAQKSNLNDGATTLLNNPTAHDLVILGVSEPTEAGLLLMRTIRARGITVPIIVISSLRSRENLQKSIALGASDYLLAPLSFTLFAQRIRQVRTFCQKKMMPDAAPGNRRLSQEHIDELIAAHHPRACTDIKKGLAPATLLLIRRALCVAPESSAEQIAGIAHLSRVTARRYLEHLVDIGQAKRTSMYGATGRPCSIYRPAVL